jgi:hypothetical protein
MNEYLTFDRFITPVIIQILFWLGLAGIVVMALLLIVNSPGGGGGLIGLIYLVLGPIIWRVYCEILLVMFKILEELRLIRKQGEARP